MSSGDSMKQIFIGIDLGSSGIRVEVYDIEGNLIAIGKEPISNQTGEEWLRALEASVPNIVKECINCEKHVSVTSTSGTLIGVSKYGEIVYGPLMYYERADEWYEKIKNYNSIKMLNEKGVKIDRTSPPVKILKLKNERRDIYDNVRWFISPTTYLLYKLYYDEGKIWEDVCMDYTNALKFGIDITSSPPRWFYSLYDELGIDMDKLPKLAPVGEAIGVAKSRFAEKIGLKNARLYQGLTDGNAAAIAGGAVDTGDINIYIGTTTVPKIAIDKIVTHPALYYHIHPIKGYLAGSATGFTGAFLSWFSEKVLGIPLDKASEYVEKVKAGSEYMFFPYGDRGPTYNPLLEPAIIGIKISDEPKEILLGRFIRSIMLGITLLENYFIELFRELFSINIGYVNLTGGGTKSKMWNKIRASIYGKRIIVHGDLVGTGIIIPLLIRNRFYSSIDEVKKVFLKPVDVVEPDESMIEIYRPYKEVFIKKWQKLQDLYRA
ncbi:MAG: FGGY-family carbohydrate kinase [Thermoproteota archaeon]